MRKTSNLALKPLKFAFDKSKAIKRIYRMKMARVHPEPIIIIGNQKSGTTAIASLLGEATGQSVTIDMFHLINKKEPFYRESLYKLYSQSLNLNSFIEKKAFYFSTKIIKEPELTFFYESLTEIFPRAKFVFVVRDPRDNIRSILNRLDIPGNLPSIEKEYTDKLQETIAWQLIVQGECPKIAGKNYIERLSNRWNMASDIYLHNKANIVIIRYEDFVKNKVSSINHLAEKVGLEMINDISEKVNIQYQPRGNHNISIKAFFGKENLKIINTCCEDKMKKFSYLL